MLVESCASFCISAWSDDDDDDRRQDMMNESRAGWNLFLVDLTFWIFIAERANVPFTLSWRWTRASVLSSWLEFWIPSRRESADITRISTVWVELSSSVYHEEDIIALTRNKAKSARFLVVWAAIYGREKGDESDELRPKSTDDEWVRE